MVASRAGNPFEQFPGADVSSGDNNHLKWKFCGEQLPMDLFNRPDAQSAGELEDNGAIIGEFEPATRFPYVSLAGKSG